MLNLFNQFITDDQYNTAFKNGISKRRVEHRVRAMYWDIERAITQPVKNRSAKYITNDVREEAAKLGISYSLIRKRISSGMTLNDAITTPLADKKQQAENARKNNKKYPDWVYKKLEENAISTSTFYKRINKSRWSVIEACTKPVMSNREKGLLNKDKRKIVFGKALYCKQSNLTK